MIKRHMTLPTLPTVVAAAASCISAIRWLWHGWCWILAWTPRALLRPCCTMWWRTLPLTLDDLKAAFGEEVALLVDGVTKLTKIQFSNIEELQAENLRKMLLAMSRDVRVMIIVVRPAAQHAHR